MKAIVFKNDDVLAIPKKQLRKCIVLEICKDSYAKEKLAYWRNLLFPEPVEEVKYLWINPITNETVYSIYEDKLIGIPNANDYVKV